MLSFVGSWFESGLRERNFCCLINSAAAAGSDRAIDDATGSFCEGQPCNFSGRFTLTADEKYTIRICAVPKSCVSGSQQNALANEAITMPNRSLLSSIASLDFRRLAGKEKGRRPSFALPCTQIAMAATSCVHRGRQHAQCISETVDSILV